MRNVRTNLLPPERRNLLRRDYFFRLAVTTLVMATALVGMAAILLIPTYVYLSQSANTKRAHLASVDAALASSDESGLAARLTALSTDAATLVALKKAPSIANLMQELLALSRPGITLSGFSYTPASGTKQGTLAVSGLAVTRDSLRQYQLALQGTSFAGSADLPVSAYAKDTDIPFTITLTLTP